MSDPHATLRLTKGKKMAVVSCKCPTCHKVRAIIRGFEATASVCSECREASK